MPRALRSARDFRASADRAGAVPCEAVASQDFLGSVERAASVPRAARSVAAGRTVGVVGFGRMGALWGHRPTGLPGQRGSCRPGALAARHPPNEDTTDFQAVGQCGPVSWWHGLRNAANADSSSPRT